MSPRPDQLRSPDLATTFTDRTYAEFKTDCLKCKRCRLAGTRTQVVVDDGPAPCDLMLIGEGPGADEDAQGIPFVGRSGQLLTKILETVDIKRPKDVYITNVVKCRPPGNRAPEPDEEALCRPWLEEQIKLIKPRIIVLVGAVAMKALLGREKAITQMRGTWTQYNGIDTTVIFHPSYLLRYPSPDKGKPKWLTWQDMKAIKNALELYKSSVA
jgi:uracil-DNA glycosylase